MSCSDPIADMLTRIRNASKAGLPAVEMGHSRLKAEIARILKKEGYIADSADFDDEGRKGLRITLKYDYNDKPIIQQLRRVSKPGLRRYAPCDKIPSVLDGMGLVILSTSKGVMSGVSAKKERLGGEIICTVA